MAELVPRIHKSHLVPILKNLSSTQLSIELIMLIHVKMPTNVGFLKFTIMMNTTSESLKANKVTSERLNQIK